MSEKRDKWEEAFARLAECPRPHFVSYISSSSDKSYLPAGGPSIYRKGYSTQSSVDNPVDDDRFLGKFGLMDKFLCKVPECVVRGAWLHFLTTKDIVRLDSAVCGGMRRRLRQSLNGYIFPHFEYDITFINFQWLTKRGIIVPNLRVCRRERNLSFLARCKGSIEWLQSLNLSHCDKIDQTSLFELTSASLPNLISLDVTHTSSLSAEGVLSLVKASTCLTTLKVSQKPCIDDHFISQLTRHVTTLTSLDIGGTSHSDVGLTQITQAYCNTLQHLSIAYSFYTSVTSIQTIATCCHLTHLSFENCMAVISDYVVSIIARSCPLLTHFDLSGCGSITDNAFLAIADNCHGMVDLGLFISVAVSAEALAALSSGCTNLAALGFEYSVRITPEAFRMLLSWFPRLVKLQLLHTAVCDEDFLLLATSHRNRPLGEGLQCLQIVCSGPNTSLTDTGIMSACQACWSDLTVLSLRDCVELTDASLITLSQYCPKLSIIRVDAHHVTDNGLSAIANGCKLTELHLYSAFNITNAGIVELFGSCLHLCSVVMYGCINVSSACIVNMATEHPHIAVSISNQFH